MSDPLNGCLTGPADSSCCINVLAYRQVYSHFDGFQLHDVVEVLGVMSVVPGLAALQQHGRDADQQHQQGRHGGNDAVAADDAGAAGAAADGMDVDDGFWQNEVAALPPTSQVSRGVKLLLFMLRLPTAHPAYVRQLVTPAESSGSWPLLHCPLSVAARQCVQR